MRKVLVLQHVAHELLGTLNPILKEHKLKIRYVNFERTPEAEPDILGYNGLVVLGGPMGVYEADKHPHIVHELRVIEDALKMDIPVLGICLGAQMIAQVLGAHVGPNPIKEIGWHRVDFNSDAKKTPFFKNFNDSEMIFQLHGDSFEIPDSCVHLASAEACGGQAFRYGKKVHGLQFHIEVDEPMIKRWMKIPIIMEDMKKHDYVASRDEILKDTTAHIDRSMELSRQCFQAFVELFELPDQPEILGSGHGKPSGGFGE